jgi:class 3 adenylate cyclase
MLHNSFFWCTILSFLTFLRAYPQIINLPIQDKEISVALKAQHYEDKEGNLTITDVSKISFENNWKQSQKSTIGYAYTNSSIWVRFQIKNLVPQQTDWVLASSYAWLNKAEIYIQKSGEPIKRHDIGNEDLAIKKRFIPHPSINFPIAQADTLTYTYYIRVNSRGCVLMPLRLLRTADFQIESRFREGLYGILLGIALFIILNSFFIYLNIRDISYLLYIVYVLFAIGTFTSLSGYLFLYLPWLDVPYLYHPIVLSLLVLPSLVGCLFTISFFGLHKSKSIYFHVLRYMILLYAVLVVISLFWQTTTLYLIYGSLFPITLFIFVNIGRQAWKRGSSEARYFTMGYLSYFLFSTPTNLYYASILEESLLTTHSVEFGIVLEMFFLAYSLADKTRVERRKAEKERKEAQEEAIRIQREANEQLERKVKERTSQLAEAMEELQQSNEELNTTLELVEIERQKSDQLLLNILPEMVAVELKNQGFATPRSYEKVTVLFTDFKGFTQIVSKMKPEQILDNLNYCFTAFDKIIRKYKLEKIKTIGDAYMCAGGLPTPDDDNPVRVIQAALEIMTFMQNWKAKKTRQGKDAWDIRLGIHTGSVVAGVVGDYKFAYDIWGDAVNTASRMESSGEESKINISGTTYELVKEHFACTYRGAIEAKNKGKIDMYFVHHAL